MTYLDDVAAHRRRPCTVDLSIVWVCHEIDRIAPSVSTSYPFWIRTIYVKPRRWSQSPTIQCYDATYVLILFTSHNYDTFTRAQSIGVIHGRYPTIPNFSGLGYIYPLFRTQVKNLLSSAAVNRGDLQ